MVLLLKRTQEKLHHFSASKQPIIVNTPQQDNNEITPENAEQPDAQFMQSLSQLPEHDPITGQRLKTTISTVDISADFLSCIGLHVEKQ